MVRKTISLMEDNGRRQWSETSEGLKDKSDSLESYTQQKYFPKQRQDKDFFRHTKAENASPAD